MDLQEAITRIGEIQTQLERTQTFRGYRAVAIGASGVLACCGAFAQWLLIPRPMDQVPTWLALWIGVAVLSVLITGRDLARRVTDRSSPRVARSAQAAVRQFVPCLVAGVAVTWAIVDTTPINTWMLPGLWSVLFSLGVFASLPMLPRAAFSVGLHYLLAGFLCLQFGNGEAALAPWTMVLCFGFGQFLTAGILYYTLERSDV